ncbi:hypothetical protein H5410_059794 [Solanum commersonii]|uniref:Uncharacterized protein n=1 Tax=Solanum commersonii TaxID=4109 RepID=A0A9J5W417_SOLCO|nr:hypothetical protein H5410_059794 [Solanum commersonii]
MGRETDIAKRFTSYQRKSRSRETNGWGREELHNQIKSFEAYEEDLTHTVGTTQEWLRELSRENMEEAKGQVLKADRELD